MQVYPSWWGDHLPQPAALSHQVQGSIQQPRPPPRLAYAVHHQPEADMLLHSNDLITAVYLDIPSSGYGAAQTSSAAKRALVWEGQAHHATASKKQVDLKKRDAAGTCHSYTD